MMEKEKILEILNEHYSVCFDSLEFVRDSGSMAYAVFSGRDKYFLRITKPAFFDTVHKSLEIHVFLMKQGFSSAAGYFPGMAHLVSIRVKKTENIFIFCMSS